MIVGIKKIGRAGGVEMSSHSDSTVTSLEAWMQTHLLTSNWFYLGSATLNGWYALATELKDKRIGLICLRTSNNLVNWALTLAADFFKF